MKCKKCKKVIHYCGSDRYMSNGYCSQECYELTDEYKELSKRLEDFYNSLSKDQKFDMMNT